VAKEEQHISSLASSALGKEQKRFVLLHMPTGADETAAIQQLLAILGDIKRPQGVTLVMGSEDTAAMARIMKGVFAKQPAHKLSGCLIAFVGAPPDEQSVGEAVIPSGAQFRFIEYKP
jgi:hypothetical protein